MKWVSKNKLELYRFHLFLDELISPVYNLIIELSAQRRKGKDFYEWIGDLFKLNELDCEGIIRKNLTQEEFLQVIQLKLKDHLFSQLHLFDNKDIMLIFIVKNFVVVDSEKITNPTSVMINWVRNSKLIEKFFDLVADDWIVGCRDILTKFFNDQIMEHTIIRVNKVGALDSTLMSKDYLHISGREEPIDPASIWVCKKWRDSIMDWAEADMTEVILNTGDSIICIGDMALPLINVDSFIKEDKYKDYFWLILNEVYACRNKRARKKSDGIIRFKDASKQQEFMTVLSSLDNNLYVVDGTIKIDEQFMPFFEKVYCIDDTKALKGYIIFTGSLTNDQIDQKQTMLGIYEKEKKGSEYNLRLWINAETKEEQIITSSNNSQKSSYAIAYALKPEYSYYLCSYFFEDMFTTVLDEIDSEHISDFNLYKDHTNEIFIQIDSLARRNDGSLVYFENKTTLSKFNIEETIKKIEGFQEIIAKSYDGVKIDYYIVAPFMNDNVRDSFSFFIQQMEDNTGVVLPYDFQIPIPKFAELRLNCIVEPSYDKLKNKIESILQ